MANAGLLQRTVSYAIVGGIASLVNLGVLDACLNALPAHAGGDAHWLIAFLIATEISIVANFVLNDRFTFGRLPGHARSWPARCLRFHSTTVVGTTMTLVVSYALYRWLGVRALVAQAIAIAIAVVFNFACHHLWTYRAVRAAPEGLRTERQLG